MSALCTPSVDEWLHPGQRSGSWHRLTRGRAVLAREDGRGQPRSAGTEEAGSPSALPRSASGAGSRLPPVAWLSSFPLVPHFPFPRKMLSKEGSREG